jgi:L-alanine-DL-glutamate epimerase-like enolase superfamily enzyme
VAGGHDRPPGRALSPYPQLESALRVWTAGPLPWAALEGGALVAPSGPGLGVELDDAAVARYRVG